MTDAPSIWEGDGGVICSDYVGRSPASRVSAPFEAICRAAYGEVVGSKGAACPALVRTHEVAPSSRPTEGHSLACGN